MSFSVALAWSLGRSALVAVAAAVAGRSVSRVLTEARGAVRTVCWILLLIPWLIPGLLLGYAWNGWVFAIHGWAVSRDLSGLTRIANLLLNHDRICNELALCCLLFSRCLPWATVMLRWGVSGEESESSWFLRGLADGVARVGRGRRPWTLFRRLRRESQRLAPAVGLAFITCFQEFELVARLGRPSWTVWLIDAHATGVAVSGLLFRATVAAGLQTLLVGAVLPVRQGLFTPGRGGRNEVNHGTLLRILVLGLLVAGAGAAVVIPGLSLAAGFLQGVTALADRTAVLLRLVREVSVGGAVATIAATLAILIARFLQTAPGQVESPSAISHASPFPSHGWLGAVRVSGNWFLFWLGAWGAVPLCLLTLGSLAPVGLASLGQSLIPWCVVQSIWLFPRAVCLMSLVQVWRQPQPAYLGKLLASAPEADRRHSADQLWWRDNWRNPVMAGLFLAMTAYFDLPTGQLLAPAGLASAPVTLYTQMHYGRNSLLTAMTLLAVAIPWTLALFILLVLPRVTIWRRGRSIPPGGWSRSR